MALDIVGSHLNSLHISGLSAATRSQSFSRSCLHMQVSRLGVCSILVRTSTGVCVDELKRSLDQFARQK